MHLLARGGGGAGKPSAVPRAQGGSGRGLMAGQPQTPQGGEPGPGGHGQSQEGSVVVETSGRCKKLEERDAQKRVTDAWNLIDRT